MTRTTVPYKVRPGRAALNEELIRASPRGLAGSGVLIELIAFRVRARIRT
jgi:hypothetical protein